MILVDSSAWIEFDRGTESAVAKRVKSLIATNGELAVTEPVLMEVLIGARSDAHETMLRRLLMSFRLLPFETVVDFEAATVINRKCRASGVTTRGSVDCMIAAVAWRSGASILSQDRDLARVANVIGVRLDPASLASS